MNTITINTRGGAVTVTLGRFKTIYQARSVKSEKLEDVLEVLFPNEINNICIAIDKRETEMSIMRQSLVAQRHLYSVASNPKDSLDHFRALQEIGVTACSLELSCEGEECQETCAIETGEWAPIGDLATECLDLNNWDVERCLCECCGSSEAELETRLREIA